MGAKRGIDCKFYRNTGSVGTPTWNEVTKLRDLSRSLQKGESEAGARDSSWELFIGTRKRLEITGNMVADRVADDYDAIEGYYEDDTVVDFAMSDGSISSSGSHYLRFEGEVFAFDQGEPLDGHVTNDITIKPSARGTTTPSFVTVV